jgi:predicted Mrr-cat superfamily restriction endonuclease
MTGVFCVRADFGTYTRQFLQGGYAAIGWMPNTDLSGITGKEQLYPLYRLAHPEDTSNIVIGQQVGQIARFLLDIHGGDFIITPAADTEWLHYGKVAPDPSYYHGTTEDGCPHRHRRSVEWAPQRLKRSDFSVPFQNTIRASLTVFAVAQRDEFFEMIGRRDLVVGPPPRKYDPYQAVLDQVLQLDGKEFEILVAYLLAALGFEGSEVTGKTGDGGVDAIGELNVANLAKVKLFVQAKRYRLGAKVSASTVRQLRQAIPSAGQGAFITTASYQDKAEEVALEPGFPRIGLINGRQLVDLLVEHWDDIPAEFRDRLGLKHGLVLA